MTEFIVLDGQSVAVVGFTLIFVGFGAVEATVCSFISTLIDTALPRLYKNVCHHIAYFFISSIFISIFHRLSVVRSRRQQVWERNPNTVSSATLSSSSYSRNPLRLSQARGSIGSLQRVLGLLVVEHTWKTSEGRHPGGILIRYLNHHN